MSRFCKKCGSELHNGTYYCVKCGAKLGITDIPVIQNIKQSISDLPVKKNLIISNIVLILFSLILGITATFDVKIFTVNYDFERKLSDVKTYSVISPVSIMIAEIIGLNNEYIMYIVNVLLYSIAILSILIPLIQKKTLKSVNFRMTKIAVFISIIEFILFAIIANFNHGDYLYTRLSYSLNISGWLMIICTLATLVTSFMISHRLKKEKNSTEQTL